MSDLIGLAAAVDHLLHTYRRQMPPPGRDDGEVLVRGSLAILNPAVEGEVTGLDLLNVEQEPPPETVLFAEYLSPLQYDLCGVCEALSRNQEAAYFCAAFERLARAPVWKWRRFTDGVAGRYAAQPVERLLEVEIAAAYPTTEPSPVERGRWTVQRSIEDVRGWKGVAWSGELIRRRLLEVRPLLREAGLSDMAFLCDVPDLCSVERAIPFLSECLRRLDTLAVVVSAPNDQAAAAEAVSADHSSNPTAEGESADHPTGEAAAADCNAGQDAAVEAVLQGQETMDGAVSAKGPQARRDHARRRNELLEPHWNAGIRDPEQLHKIGLETDASLFLVKKKGKAKPARNKKGEERIREYITPKTMIESLKRYLASKTDRPEMHS